MIKKNFRKKFLEIISVFIILILIIYSNKIIPIESAFFRQIVRSLLLLSVVYIIIKINYNNNYNYFGLNFKKKLPNNAIKKAIIIGLFVGSVTIVLLFFIFIKGDASNYLKGLNKGQAVFLAIILAPFIEEILFRGYIQTVLKNLLSGNNNKSAFHYWGPIIFTAILFSGLHFTALRNVSLRQTLSAVLLALIMGIISGVFREKYHSVKPSIVLHIFSNIGSMFVGGFLILIFLSTPERIAFIRKMNKPEYHFDMNDSATFNKSLCNFSIYEKNRPDSLMGKERNVSVRFLLTVDTSGMITDIKFDRIMGSVGKKIIVNSDFYKNNAITVARELPQFIPPKNLKKDTTIVFYVCYH